MSAGWVAAGVRATALARRRIGRDGVRRLATCATVPAALEVLSHTPYQLHVHPGQTLAEAEREVAATALWHLRVLAGWVPGPGVAVLRPLTGWFEIANVDERLREFSGERPEPPFQLGALATAWPQVAAATDVQQLRTALATSSWGDPGSAEPAEIALGMRLSWAVRTSSRSSTARPWAAGGAALLIAGWRFMGQRTLSGTARRLAARVLGAGCLDAATLADFAAALDRDARWAVDGIRPDDLWQAEFRWWERVRVDATAQLRRADFGPRRMVGTAALLACDAWQVRAALEVAARGGAATSGSRSTHGVAEVLGALA